MTNTSVESMSVYYVLFVSSMYTSMPYVAFLQVSVVFDLEASACSGELAFMERYNQVLMELGQVEQKMESQSMSSSSSSSEGLGSAAVPVTGRTRLGSSGRSTLQAIGSAAAAGFTLCCFLFHLDSSNSRNTLS